MVDKNRDTSTQEIIVYDGPSPPMPEQSTLLLMGIGIVTLFGLIFFKKRGTSIGWTEKKLKKKKQG